MVEAQGNKQAYERLGTRAEILPTSCRQHSERDGATPAPPPDQRTVAEPAAESIHK